MCDVVFCTCVPVDIVLHLLAGPYNLLAGILSNPLHGCPVHFGQSAGTQLIIQVIESYLSVSCVPLVYPHEPDFPRDLAALRMSMPSRLILMINIMRSFILLFVSAAYFFSIVLHLIDYVSDNKNKTHVAKNIK